MSRSSSEVIADIAAFAPPNDDWTHLDSLLEELWRAGVPESYASDLLRIFERFPVEEDGGGVFWSIVHGLERVGGYESALLRSVRASPSEFGIVMIGRLLNAGVTKIDDSDLRDVLSAASSGPGVPSRVAKVASRFLARIQR